MKEENYSDTVIRFLNHVRDFVELLENARAFSQADFIRKLRFSLSQVYYSAAGMEREGELSEHELEQFVEEMQYHAIKEAVSEKLERFDQVLHFDDTMLMNTEDYLHVSLSEICADVYQDLGDFVARYRFGNMDTHEDALNECMHKFEEYWGLRVLVILQELHRILNSEEFIEDK